MMFYCRRPQVHKQPVPRGVAAPSQRYWIDIFLKDQWAIQVGPGVARPPRK
jgi:hypothetical protein